MANTPHVGAIIHYVSYGTPGGEYGSVCRAAMITASPPVRTATVDQQPNVALVVFNPTGTFHNTDVPHDPGNVDPTDDTELCTGLTHAGGTWHHLPS